MNNPSYFFLHLFLLRADTNQFRDYIINSNSDALTQPTQNKLFAYCLRTLLLSTVCSYVYPAGRHNEYTTNSTFYKLSMPSPTQINTKRLFFFYLFHFSVYTNYIYVRTCNFEIFSLILKNILKLQIMLVS